MILKSPLLILIVVLGCSLRPALADSLTVHGTDLRVTGPGGVTLTGKDLVGALVSFADAEGNSLPLRIDEVLPDPQDFSGEILLYRFMQQDTASGQWKPFCAPGPDGLAVGFPLSGTWSADGAHRSSDDEISLVCAGSAIGKCLRLGYRLWGNADDGTPLKLYHQACTRMMRADYCGDGRSHTRDGTPIHFQDRLGLHRNPPPAKAVFEALWGPQGAICVKRPRLPAQRELDSLVTACPRLAGYVGPVCRAEALDESPDILIRSYGRVSSNPQP